MMTEIEIIDKAKSLIERGWCKGHGALDENMRPANSLKTARYFCAMGALSAAANGIEVPYNAPAHAAYMQLFQKLDRYTMRITGAAGRMRCLTEFNDHRDTEKADVLNLLEGFKLTLEETNESDRHDTSNRGESRAGDGAGGEETTVPDVQEVVVSQVHAGHPAGVLEPA